MGEPAFANLEDLEARLGPLSDRSRAQAAIDDASSLIHLISRRHWVVEADEGDVLASGVPGAVKAICCAVARRVLENPNAISQHTESIANFSEARTYSVASNDVYLTQAELRRIRQAAGMAGISVLGVTRGELETKPVRDELWPFLDE
jgi:hypothetical protein